MCDCDFMSHLMETLQSQNCVLSTWAKHRQRFAHIRNGNAVEQFLFPDGVWLVRIDYLDLADLVIYVHIFPVCYCLRTSCPPLMSQSCFLAPQPPLLSPPLLSPRSCRLWPCFLIRCGSHCLPPITWATLMDGCKQPLCCLGLEVKAPVTLT